MIFCVFPLFLKAELFWVLFWTVGTSTLHEDFSLTWRAREKAWLESWQTASGFGFCALAGSLSYFVSLSLAFVCRIGALITATALTWGLEAVTMFSPQQWPGRSSELRFVIRDLDRRPVLMTHPALTPKALAFLARCPGPYRRSLLSL